MYISYYYYYYYNLQKWAQKKNRMNAGEILTFEARSRMKRSLMYLSSDLSPLPKSKSAKVFFFFLEKKITLWPHY